MPAFESAHLRRVMTDTTSSVVSETFYAHGLSQHDGRIVAMLGACERLIEHSVERTKTHGNSNKAKEALRLQKELGRLSFEIERYFDQHVNPLKKSA